jgi:mannose-6-phosphate isomerase-like protein (cupin superfamily)
MPIQFFHQTIALLAARGTTTVYSLHVHHREDEAFYILEGEYSVFIGDEVVAGVPDTWVYGPRGVPHGYQVHSERGRHLSLTVPAGFESFFEEVAEFATPSADPRDTMSQVAVVAARYGVELVGPAPAPR